MVERVSRHSKGFFEFIPKKDVFSKYMGNPVFASHQRPSAAKAFESDEDLIVGR